MSARQRNRRIARRGRRLAAALVALLTTVAALAALAAAQIVNPSLLPDPSTPLPDPPPEADTDATPIAKEYAGWTRVAGANFGAAAVAKGSATPFGADLHTVAMRNLTRGYAGGSVCREEPQRREDEEPAAFAGRVADCERVPVLYRYDRVDVEDPSVEGGVRREDRWTEVLRGETPGYVGAIAFLDAERVLAVGGTGTYPRRERSAQGKSYEEWVAEDPAGRGRAWLHEAGSWRELTVPEQMRGLTALAASPQVGSELGVAGGLGQLWVWRDGRFGDLADRTSPPERLQDADRFRFRVRAIAFGRIDEELPGDRPPDPDASPTDPLTGRPSNRPPPPGVRLLAYAAVAGCCAAEPDANEPRLLAYDGARWRDSGLDDESALTGTRPPSSGAEPGAQSFLDAWIQDDDPRTEFNESEVELLTGPDGPEAPVEVSNADNGRLVSFDGTPGRPDAVPPTPRWSVGALRSGQGLATSTHLREPGCEAPSSDSGGGANGNDESGVDPEGTRDCERSWNYFELPAYAVNAIDMVEPTGVGWAVGDRGAILRVSEVEETARRQPDPPELTDRAPSPIVGDELYDAFRPLPAAGGPGPVVPALAEQPLERGAPAFVSGGWVDPARRSEPDFIRVQSIVMRRDGGEGFALESGIGLGRDRPSRLHRFDGEQWRPCDPVGVAGLLPADEACAGARLEDPRDGPLPLLAMARVPLERDDDPANDDELEIVAISAATSGRHRYQVVRYRDGRWRPEAVLRGYDVSFGADIAFATPTDGFVRLDQSGRAVYRHFDGRDWAECEGPGGADLARRCGTSGDQLPSFSTRGLRFVTAGARIYLIGGRTTGLFGDASVAPLIYRRDPGGEWTADLDPGPTGDWEGQVLALAMTPGDDGHSGWAFATRDGREVLARVSDGKVEPWTERDASAEYLGAREPGEQPPPVLMAAAGGAPFVLEPPGDGPLLRFDEDAERWRVLPAPFLDGYSASWLLAGGRAEALAPDERGGFWAAVRPRDNTLGRAGGVAFLRHTAGAPRPVLTPAPHPLEGGIGALAAAPGGRVWLGGSSGTLATYDRVTGWDQVRIRGWDLTTAARRVSALAVGPDGRGVAVGPGGRIANVGPQGVALDPAAGTVCAVTREGPPCGTGYDLSAAAVAPDGSAMVAGERMTILWRPPGDGFRAVAGPLDAGPGTTVTAIALPRGNRA